MTRRLVRSRRSRGPTESVPAGAGPYLAGAGLLGGTLLGGWMAEATLLEVVRHDVPVRGLPLALDGLRIAHVSDVHLRRMHSAARRALEAIGRERPEVVVLTGDIAERPAAIGELEAFAREARGTLATYATLGNWEYIREIVPAASRAYERAGVDLLVNEARSLAVDGARIGLIGLDDPHSGRPDLRAALRRYEPGDANLWLVHAPGIADRLRGLVDCPPHLILAGHTHGGQVRIPLLPPVLPHGSGRFVAGWYRDTLAPLYVSRGIGTSTLPIRFRCTPELPIFTLRAT